MFIKDEFLTPNAVLQNKQFKLSMSAREWIGAEQINYEEMNSRDQPIPYMGIQYNSARARKLIQEFVVKNCIKNLKLKY